MGGKQKILNVVTYSQITESKKKTTVTNFFNGAKSFFGRGDF